MNFAKMSKEELRALARRGGKSKSSKRYRWTSETGRAAAKKAVEKRNGKR